MCNVSNTNEVVENDILAAMGQGIADGIDIMLLSLGFEQMIYFKDVISIGFLSAYEKGIVVFVDGNEDSYSSEINIAPWILTVDVDTIDQSFIGTVTLRNR
ncbi:hypothetical protein V6N13_054013 [Hibiscus sabdariffa]